MWCQLVLDEVAAPRQAPPGTPARGLFMPIFSNIRRLAGPSWAFPVYGASKRGAFGHTGPVNIVDALALSR